MEIWYDYKRAWAIAPLLRVYFVIVVLVLLLAIFGTFSHGVLAILFVPSLAGAYVHHLMAMKRINP